MLNDQAWVAPKPLRCDAALLEMCCLPAQRFPITERGYLVILLPLTLLCLLPQVWIAPSTGVASAFLEQLEKISSDSTALMLAIFAVFALVHSGLAYLRPYGTVLHLQHMSKPWACSLIHAQEPTYQHTRTC